MGIKESIADPNGKMLINESDASYKCLIRDIMVVSHSKRTGKRDGRYFLTISKQVAEEINRWLYFDGVNFTPGGPGEGAIELIRYKYGKMKAEFPWHEDATGVYVFNGTRFEKYIAPEIVQPHCNNK